MDGVLANMGTPLMWVGMLHLFIGNFVIGIFEALLLARIFRADRGIAIGILVLANYGSAWLGYLIVINGMLPTVSMTIEDVGFWIWTWMGLAFLFTLLVELPFFWFVLRGRIWRAVRATAVVHGISYGVLIWIYWSASGTGMVTRLDVVDASEMRVDGGYALYYITEDGSGVCRMDFGTGGVEVIREVKAEHWNDRIFVRESEDGTRDICLFYTSEEGKGEEVLVENFSGDVPEYRNESGGERGQRETWWNFGEVPTLSEGSGWKFTTGFWPVQGIRVSKEGGEGWEKYALETPMAAWSVRNGVELEEGYVVFQLGERQICVLDAAGRRLALVAMGKGVLAVRDEKL